MDFRCLCSALPRCLPSPLEARVPRPHLHARACAHMHTRAHAQVNKSLVEQAGMQAAVPTVGRAQSVANLGFQVGWSGAGGGGEPECWVGGEVGGARGAQGGGEEAGGRGRSALGPLPTAAPGPGRSSAANTPKSQVIRLCQPTSSAPATTASSPALTNPASLARLPATALQADASVDAVVSLCAFADASDVQRAALLQEALRVLKPGRPLVFIERGGAAPARRAGLCRCRGARPCCRLLFSGPGPRDMRRLGPACAPCLHPDHPSAQLEGTNQWRRYMSFDANSIYYFIRLHVNSKASWYPVAQPPCFPLPPDLPLLSPRGHGLAGHVMRTAFPLHIYACKAKNTG